MLDLETLGLDASCKILSIGAVEFDPYAKEFTINSGVYFVCSLEDQTNRTTNAKTLAWWEQQSAEARAVFNDPNKQLLRLELTQFAAWLGKPDELWSMGADFDIAILAHAYTYNAEIDILWKHGVQRCFRTLKNLYQSIASPVAVVKHNALEDAKTQAEWCWRIMQERNKKL